MKKAILAILAVAILGALALYSNDKKTNTSQPVTIASSNQSNTSTTTLGQSTSTGAYKDGTYSGDSQDTPYGTVQVAAVISGGKITDIKFLQMPYQEGHSREVTVFSESPLRQSALSKQSASIDFVSGATDTSYGFEQSLQAALDQAKMS